MEEEKEKFNYLKRKRRRRIEGKVADCSSNIIRHGNSLKTIETLTPT